MAKLSRRTMLEAGGAMLTTGLRREGAAGELRTTPTPYLFFNREEAAFVEAAVSRLIPGDDKSPGALEAGVPNYIDKQLGAAWGAGERLYRSGPCQPPPPTQPSHFPFTPPPPFPTPLPP